METIVPFTYLDYELVPVMIYSNGKYDWQIYKKDAGYGTIVPYKTLEEVKEEINQLTQTEKI